jgi:hypothetical protein
MRAMNIHFLLFISFEIFICCHATLCVHDRLRITVLSPKIGIFGTAPVFLS